MSLLKDKVAIVTGASSGIGRAAAILFARQGARVIVGARRTQDLNEVVEEIVRGGGKAHAVAGDLQDEAVSKRLVDAAVKVFGGLDIAFNNAGATGEAAPVPELTSEGWRNTIDTNLSSAFYCAKHQIPAMLARGRGSIIFTSSFVGNSAGFPGTAAYAASKAGIIGLMKTIAVEFGARNIRANAILPGGTDTPANYANAPGASKETRDFIEGLHALKRLGKPEEIANVALLLASDGAGFVTGAAIPVDGGVSINRT